MCLLSMAAAHEDHDHDHEHHEGHGEDEVCACAKDEEKHPFELACKGTLALTNAQTTLNSASCTATESSCKEEELNSVGIMECQTAFFVLQAHHDFCESDTLTSAQEQLVHDFEGACYSCTITRPADRGLEECVAPRDCEDPAPAAAGPLSAPHPIDSPRYSYARALWR
jgi:hypothetical protein